MLPNTAPLGKSTLPLAALGDALQSGTLRSVHPIPDKVCRSRSGGTTASLRAHAIRAVRQLVWLEVESDNMALSRPIHQRVPFTGCYAIPLGKNTLGDSDASRWVANNQSYGEIHENNLSF
jgi:hypothetical protein